MSKDMELLKVFCVVYNAHDVIEDFILYHGYLFGYNNIVIIDNHSTHPDLPAIYEKYIALGVTVHPLNAFDATGQLYTTYMQQYKATSKFLMGLEPNEFIFLTSEINQIDKCMDREAITAHIESIPESASYIGFQSVCASIVDPCNPHLIDYRHARPAFQMVSFCEPETVVTAPAPKHFYRAAHFVSTLGTNVSGVVDQGGEWKSDISCIRYCQPGPRGMEWQCRDIIDAFGYTDVTATLPDQILSLQDFKRGYQYADQVCTYVRLITRRYICQASLTFIKRLPTLEELTTMEDMFPGEIEQALTSSPDAVANQNKKAPTPAQSEMDYLIYYVPAMHMQEGIAHRRMRFLHLFHKLLVLGQSN